VQTIPSPVGTPSGSQRPSAPRWPSDLRLAIMRTARQLRRAGSTGQVTSAQYGVLVCLQESPQTLGALAALEQVRPPFMTRTVVTLESLGLVVRSPHPTDGRQVLVDVTPDGRACIAETRRRRNEWLNQRLAALSDHQRAVLAEAAEILLDVNAQ
jgi:DNA-binding MarR family transcriptional regulator